MYTDRDRDEWTRTERIDKISRKGINRSCTGDIHKVSYIANDKFQEDTIAENRRYDG